MATAKRYVFNPRTLSYEVKRRSRRSRALRTVVMFALSLGMAVLSRRTRRFSCSSQT